MGVRPRFQTDRTYTAKEPVFQADLHECASLGILSYIQAQVLIFETMCINLCIHWSPILPVCPRCTGPLFNLQRNQYRRSKVDLMHSERR